MGITPQESLDALKGDLKTFEEARAEFLLALDKFHMESLNIERLFGIWIQEEEKRMKGG